MPIWLPCILSLVLWQGTQCIHLSAEFCSVSNATPAVKNARLLALKENKSKGKKQKESHNKDGTRVGVTYGPDQES